MSEYWKKCSSCKEPISFSTAYYVCSVSTCQHVRKGYRFCSVPCWDAHLGYENHRESWAVEMRSPSEDEFETSATEQVAKREAEASTSKREPQRKIVEPLPLKSDSRKPDISSSIKTDTLVVVSKVKTLIKEQSGFNTSKCCIEALTKKVVAECLAGIEEARTAERKTVMGRDIK